jgi:hypothetical protein
MFLKVFNTKKSYNLKNATIATKNNVRKNAQKTKSSANTQENILWIGE